jgi:hypothetical protein
MLCETSATISRKTTAAGGGMQELMTYEDVSRITRFKINTLRKWVQLRKIPFVKINGAIRFNPEEIRAWTAGEQGTDKGRSRGVDDGKRGVNELFPEMKGAGR